MTLLGALLWPTDSWTEHTGTFTMTLRKPELEILKWLKINAEIWQPLKLEAWSRQFWEYHLWHFDYESPGPGTGRWRQRKLNWSVWSSNRNFLFFLVVPRKRSRMSEFGEVKKGRRQASGEERGGSSWEVREDTTGKTTGWEWSGNVAGELWYSAVNRLLFCALNFPLSLQ